MKQKLTAILLVLVFLLVGCQDKRKENEKNSSVVENTAIMSFPSSYQIDGEHVQLNIENIEPEEAYFIEGTAKPMELDYEKIGRMLMPDDGSNVIDKEQECILSKEMIDDIYYKEMYFWGNNYFSYDTYHGDELLTSISSEKKVSDYNLPLYAEKKEFSFGSEKEAFEEINKFLQKAGIDLGDNYEMNTYYLDHETMKAQEVHYDVDGNREEDKYKTDWSEEDDAYLFYIHQTYCGLEDYHNPDFWKGQAEDSNAQITAIYGKDGIEYMVVQNMSIYSTGEKQEKLLDFATIANAVVTYFDNILDDASYEVTSAQLICDCGTPDADGKRGIVPVWAFYVIETAKDGIAVNYELRINALTGGISQN